MRTNGVLPAQHLADLIRNGSIAVNAIADRELIQPASIDLPLGDRVYRLRASFLPGRGSKVMEKADKYSQYDFGIPSGIQQGKGAVLEVGGVYLIPLDVTLDFAKDHLSGSCNPKSSTGRLDIFVRVLTDDGVEFDKVPRGYVGRLYAEVSPLTFPIRVRQGDRLTQLRVRRDSAWLPGDTLNWVHLQTPLTSEQTPDFTNGLAVSVNLRGDLFPHPGPIGYRAKKHAPVIDLRKIKHYNPTLFWDPIHDTGEDFLILDPDAFYILASREGISIPAHLAAEMRPFVAGIGEFRAHYAGFFDPGFGGTNCHSKAVLEVRTHAVPFILEHGQQVARLDLEGLVVPPDYLYGDNGSNYQGQSLRLAKQFW